MNCGGQNLFGKSGKINKIFMDHILKSKNVLVTGGAGLVGSHLVEKLLSLGAQVFVLDIAVLPKSYFETEKLHEKVKLLVVDLVEAEKVKQVIEQNLIEYVFHLGAQAIVAEAFINPRRTFETNILGTINILEAARSSSQIKAVLVASSDKAYGKNCLNATEDNALMGDHPYDVSKSAADLITATYYKTYGTPVAISRFGNIFGPGDLHFDRIIPGIMDSIINNKTLEIRSNGQFTRDYVFVKDVVDGYISLAEHIDKIKGQGFNFSSGLNFSVLELIAQVSKILDTKVDYKILNTQQNEIPNQSLNFEKAQKVLGWKPGYVFEEAIQETYKWYKQFYN
jgi:CDP-glucose 4,6-dehydratase